MGALVPIGKDGWLKNLGITQMIPVRVVLADVRMQTPQILQAEMLEIMAVTVVMTRRIPMRILRKRLMGLKPRVRCSP